MSTGYLERRGSNLCAILQNFERLEMMLFPKKFKADFRSIRGLLTVQQHFSAEIGLVK